MLSFLFLFGLALGAVSPSGDYQVQRQYGSCPMFWSQFNGRCYTYVDARLTWADAELSCVSQGANLVSIRSMEEQNFTKSLINNFQCTKGHTWIGLSDTHKEGQWMWSDGSAVDFVLWNPGQPDNERETEHCVHNTFDRDMKWNDSPCDLRYSFVCASRLTCY